MAEQVPVNPTEGMSERTRWRKGLPSALQVWQPPRWGGAHLEANLEVLALLAAATQLSAETLVDVAAPLIRAVTAVVLAVAKQRLSHTAPAAAQELRGGVALVLWGGAEVAGQGVRGQV